MLLRQIFEKPVDRTIEGVIKADDDTCLGLEVEEYVLTNEVEKRLEEFLEAYNDYEGANGAWISGFFGSGKSHLLKMMSLLLANRTIEGKPVVEAFEEKSKHNAMLKAAITKASKIPAQSILFNIDQKADVISKSDVDALLAVFVKVFDESCGYYGKQGYIAQFERQLDEDGLLDAFQTAFESLESKGWKWARSGRIHRFASQIDQAYEAATGQRVEGIIDRFRGDYKLSIEDFAEQIDQYLKRQGDKKFRLNFCVDEVGQYIADNTKLMTNLQTIAESLATKSKGRAWVIVTAQEEMHSVVGEMGKQQGNDFSKIQARFANRMKLTSQDVAEVIQKRLLAKTEAGEAELAILFEREANNFKTLFSFSDGSKQYRTYQHQDHFVNCYPFVPYQFDLFQLAIQNLSTHNAFTGKHSSVGERSMLGVFQQVAIHIADHEAGKIATFDLMFEGIRAALKSQIQTSIHTAERNLSNPLAIRLLKALFLVKYVREFRPTVRNLCVLMLDHFDADLIQLEKDVKEALSTLESQVYIQRNGDDYEFLTDEEKDIEQEIKVTDIDSHEVTNELSKLVFEEILKTKKIRHEDTKHDYNFTRKLDDRVTGREHELTVHVISPFHDLIDRIDQLKMQTMGQAELLVVLDANDRLIRDLQLFKKTEKYIKQNVSQAQQESVKRILTDKTYTNKERLAAIRDDLKEQLGNARLFVAGSEVESSSRDPVTRLHDGFRELIRHTYKNLGMLRGIIYTEANIESCLTNDDNGLFAGDATTLSEAETEMFSLISRNSGKGVRTTIKQLVEDFECKPFGWPLAAIQCTLAKLCGRGKVEARSDSQPLEESALAAAIKNTRAHGNIVLDPQIEFTSGQIRRVKEFFQDFFDQPAHATEAKALSKEVANEMGALGDELAILQAQAAQFPFLSALEEPARTLKQLSSKSYKYFFTEFEAQAETLLDLKEDLLDPVRRFMSGPNARLYLDASQFLIANEANIAYIEGDEAAALKATLADPNCYRGDGMQQVKSQWTSLKSKVEQRLSDYREKAAAKVNQKARMIESLPNFESLADSQKQEIESAINSTLSHIKSHTSIAFVRDAPSRFETDQYKQLLRKVDSWTKPPKQPGESPTSETKPPIQYVSVTTADTSFERPLLVNQADVDEYLAALKAAMLSEIAKGHRIQL